MSDIQIKTIPEDEPQFRRHYVVDVNGRTMKIGIRYCGLLGMLMFSGELTQADGRWVLFEPERVADRVLDPALVPIIEQRIEEVRAIDKAFRKECTNEFVDGSGQKWRKV